MQQDVSCTREFKVRHSQEQAAEELTLIVDCGGRVKNISISHRVYGRVSAEMGYPFQTGCGRVCGSPAEQSLHSTQHVLPPGYHYHLVEASSEERLDLIEKQLKRSRFSGSSSAIGR